MLPFPFNFSVLSNELHWKVRAMSGLYGLADTGDFSYQSVCGTVPARMYRWLIEGKPFTDSFMVDR